MPFFKKLSKMFGPSEEETKINVRSIDGNSPGGRALLKKYREATTKKQIEKIIPEINEDNFYLSLDDHPPYEKQSIPKLETLTEEEALSFFDKGSPLDSLHDDPRDPLGLIEVISPAPKKDLRILLQEKEKKEEILLNEMINKFSGLENHMFNKNEVSLTKKFNTRLGNIERKFYEVELLSGKKVLVYRSSGSNQEETGKQKGRWFVVPGFMTSYYNQSPLKNWIIKNGQTTDYCATHKYIRGLTKFFEENYDKNDENKFEKLFL